MFTGIIENTATVIDIIASGTNISFILESELTSELKVDQSLSHNGVCLTIENIMDNRYQVTAILETLTKTNLGKLKIGDKVNLERSMPANGRFDGHIVQGHVDQIGICKKIVDKNGSWEITISHEKGLGNITVEKGSICLNGISLTVFNCSETEFTVAIIPYTWTNTNLNGIQIGDNMNLEFDIVGKYLSKMFSPYIKNIYGASEE
jgi:riboflavin synthase